MSNTNPVVLTPVTVTPELTQAVTEAVDTVDIRNIIVAEAEKQKAAADKVTADAALAAQQATDKATADTAAADEAARVAAANAPAEQFTRTEIIGGRTFEFQASSELELERVIVNALKVSAAVQTPSEPAPVDVAAAAVTAAKAAEADRAKSAEAAAARAELDIQFKAGGIAVEDYLEKTGAIDSYLPKKSISDRQSEVSGDLG